MSLGERITTLRKRTPMRQADVAKKVGVARTTYGMYETGNREPDYQILVRIAEVFDVTIDYLLTGNDNNVDLNNLRPDESMHYFDMEGLSEEDIAEIQKQIEYLRWKASQKK